MFDWVSFVLLHTHGHTLILSLLIPRHTFTHVSFQTYTYLKHDLMVNTQRVTALFLYTMTVVTIYGYCMEKRVRWMLLCEKSSNATNAQTVIERRFQSFC